MSIIEFSIETWVSANLTAVVNTLRTQLVNHGWINTVGFVYESQADSEGRKCYAEIIIDGANDMQVSIASESTLTDNLKIKNAYWSIALSTFPNTIKAYISKYWVYMYNVTDDAVAAYPLAFGLLDCPLTIAQIPGPVFLAAPYDDPAAGASAVSFNDPTGRWFIDTSTGVEIEGGAIGFNLAGNWGKSDLVVPADYMYVPVPLVSGAGAAGVEKAAGKLFYAYSIPQAGLAEGTIHNYGSEKYYVIRNNSCGNDSFAVRIV